MPPTPNRVVTDTESEEPKMKTQPESVNVQHAVRTVRDDIRTNNPHPRTTNDFRIRDVFVTHSSSTR